MNRRLHTFLMMTCVALTACTTSPIPVWKKAVAGDGPGELSSVEQSAVEVRNVPKSRSGNRPEYEVFGIRYSVLDSARGFTETGTASWYGSKFHGNATASGEIYDMHQLTAAHKHLPLPTFVRVTRIDNGQSLTVKVNDRGPFVGDRIIDLSYAAAAKLDMLDSGKAEVRIEALSHHDEPEQLARIDAPGRSDKQPRFLQFVQVGAFSSADNAQSLQQRISGSMQMPVRIDFESTQQVYQVRVGPLQDDDAVVDTLRLLASAGISGYPVRKATR